MTVKIFIKRKVQHAHAAELALLLYKVGGLSLSVSPAISQEKPTIKKNRQEI